MIAKPTLWAALALSLGLLAPGAAQADAADGERLARQWCVNCHVIDGTGPATTLPQGPPSFRIIAGHLDPAGVQLPDQSPRRDAQSQAGPRRDRQPDRYIESEVSYAHHPERRIALDQPP